MDAPLSVGFECEIKIAFDESELRAANPEVRHLQLVKDHGPVQGKRAAFSCYRDKTYQNWGIRNTISPVYFEETSLQNFHQPEHTCDFRMYKDEPLKLVRDILQRSGISSMIHADLSAKQIDFSAAPWSLQRDASLMGLTSEQKIAAFPYSISTVEEAREIDCYGVELVSWPWTSAEAAHDSVKSAGEALRAHLKHGFVADHETALHAHVGLVDGSAFPLRVLQNLFLITVLFEDEVSQLHSYQRRRGAGDFEIESNRDEFYSEGADDVSREVPDPEHPGKTITRMFIPNFMSPKEIERKIFTEVDGARDPKVRFRQLSGNKQHVVNFSYCFRDKAAGEAAPTVEFRQHDGTMDESEIFHWYHHCAGLVSLAQRYAREETTVTQRLGISTWDSRISIDDLWNEMALPEESQTFYRLRIAKFNESDPSWQPSPPVWDLIQPDSDAEEDEPAELVQKSDPSSPRAASALQVTLEHLDL